MSKLFIFSNSFAAHNLINSINYLLNVRIDEILVLGENHRQNDFIESAVKVTVSENLEFCIDNSDLIIMLLDENIPSYSSDYVWRNAKHKGKTILKLQNPWIKSDFIQDRQLYNDMKTTPSVLIISVGQEAQEIYTELAISELFLINNIAVLQVFSCSTVNIFKQLDDHHLLNHHLHNQLLNKKKKCDLCVSTVNVAGFDTREIRNICITINRICPDVLILQAGYSFEIDRIKTIIENSTSLMTDLVIRSKFFSHNDSIVYCSDTNASQELLVGQKNTPNTILNTILAKIAFPEGCMVIAGC